MGGRAGRLLRMWKKNGSCAGGTGAFIDQMATLLKMGAGGDGQSRPDSGKATYTIAARCGVFAKSDIQPLINQGAKVRRHRQEHLSGGGESDHRGSGAGDGLSRATFCIWAGR